mmetsp:Transcript_28277/g.87648  ORF Transcript_28277/g.87648 Transcript_28277/m.87648 type:complete len:204 (+) Transcript_28277:359-970(+)
MISEREQKRCRPLQPAVNAVRLRQARQMLQARTWRLGRQDPTPVGCPGQPCPVTTVAEIAEATTKEREAPLRGPVNRAVRSAVRRHRQILAKCSEVQRASLSTRRDESKWSVSATRQCEQGSRTSRGTSALQLGFSAPTSRKAQAPRPGDRCRPCEGYAMPRCFVGGRGRRARQPPSTFQKHRGIRVLATLGPILDNLQQPPL